MTARAVVGNGGCAFKAAFNLIFHEATEITSPRLQAAQIRIARRLWKQGHREPVHR
jgi:ribosomal protein L16/L10AE